MKKNTPITSWPPASVEDKKIILDVLNRQLQGTSFYYTKKFEQAFADYLGVKYCLLVNSGSAALHLAFACLKTKPNDEVIVPAFTFVATAMPALYYQIKPVFCDVSKNNIYLDPKKIKNLITPRTKAIVVAHLNGMPAEIEIIKRIARQHHLILIEDCCQAHGSIFKKKLLGSFGDIGAFSLNGSKNLPADGGGIFVTNNKNFYDLAKQVAYLGRDKNRNFNKSYRLGWKYRPSEFTAALALNRLAKLDTWNKARLENVNYLNQLLKQNKAIELFDPIADSTPAYWKYAFKIKKVAINKNQKIVSLLIGRLNQKGIDCFQWQKIALPDQPVFKNFKSRKSSFNNTHDIINRTIWLDSGIQPPNTKKQVKALAKIIDQELRLLTS